ncbi:alkaline phosphatase family protein [Methylomonas sp. EFPC3]|uniref:alkaline phosphatase family protein n=1 Tax=Methylomonas sp. EFPC3 TaxID=3021710 RepID=UPI0024166DC3|nr:alkaline phosphatase family protein [Methylomonas sp. EFPC3]WFP48918.1 alkaline phosphatase family protein [Methylomonas sp. EFPC3]
MITSIREVLNLTGKPASLREIAVKRKAVFPVSLRNLVGAPPPGKIVQKRIPLDLLQRKSDEIFENRSRPLIKIRLHNLGSGDHRHSTLTVYQDAGYQENGTQVYREASGFPRDLGQLSSRISDYHFNDLNSREILSPDFIGGTNPIMRMLIYFETGGEELKMNNWRNVNLTAFKLDLTFKFALDADNNLLVTEKSLIKADVATDAAFGWRAVVESEMESGMRNKIYDALYKKDSLTGAYAIQTLNQALKRLLLGDDFLITGISSDDEAIYIDYLLKPGQLESFPETPQAPLEPGLLSNIDHIVVLMMENRSFDHMLGYLSKHGGRSDVDGLHDGEKNRYLGKDYPSIPLTDTQFFQSPPHSHGPVEAQINAGKMDGFAAAFAQKFPQQPEIVGQIMGYHPAAHVPVYDALAREFAICDRWFAAHPGPTFCNRFYTLTGRLNRNRFGLPETDNPHLAEFQPVKTKTLFDHLSDHGVSWHYYENRYCFLRLFERYTLDDHFIVDFNDPLKGFVASAQAGTLPAVSFIDPNFVDEPDDGDNDDGPPADIRAGQNLIGTIVNALMNGPNWHKTLLLITYDEHGGFYDHVDPYDYSANAKPVSGIDHYGVRVPTFVVSPWIDAGSVSKAVFDHTSIPKTIIRRFLHTNPPDMGERVTAANDVSQMLRSTPRTDKPAIPIPPRPQVNAFAAKMAIAADPEIDDFKDIMRAMRARYPRDH